MKTKTIKYTKKEILASKKYARYADIVNALLGDEREYSLVEVDKAIFNYLKQEV